MPVVSLAGRPTVGRFGAAILHAVGLDDWITSDVDAYVARAVAAAADIDALARLRAELRPRFAASPLRDAAGLAREIEAAYRALWRRWCDDDKRDVRQLYATGDADGAGRLAERLLASDPHDASALHVLGLIKFNQGDAATATALLQRSVDAAAGCRRPVGSRRDAALDRTPGGSRSSLPPRRCSSTPRWFRRWEISAMSCWISIAPMKRKQC